MFSPDLTQLAGISQESDETVKTRPNWLRLLSKVKVKCVCI